MYTPDARIVKYLRQYDRDLGVRWDMDRSRWRVTWRGKDVSVVQNDDGSYRPLDERLVTWAKLCDSWQHKDTRSMMRIMDEDNHRMSMKQKLAVRDNLEQAMKEDGYRKVFGGPMIQGWSGASA